MADEHLRVLYVVRGKAGKVIPFVEEQIVSLQNIGVKPIYFLIGGGGIGGYLKSLLALRQVIKQVEPSLIHAHYGLSGLLANFQLGVPMVTTFHGSDVNLKKIRPLSLLACWFSKYSIFVTTKLACRLSAKRNYAVIPCDVDTKIFYPVDTLQARPTLGLLRNETTVLSVGALSPRKDHTHLIDSVQKASNRYPILSLIMLMVAAHIKGIPTIIDSIIRNANISRFGYQTPTQWYEREIEGQEKVQIRPLLGQV